MTTEEKRIVKIGTGKLEHPMTKAQAFRYGNKEMPADLRKAGFEVCVSASDLELHGGLWFRIDYCKNVPAH